MNISRLNAQVSTIALGAAFAIASPAMAQDETAPTEEEAFGDEIVGRGRVSPSCDFSLIVLYGRRQRVVFVEASRPIPLCTGSDYHVGQ